MTVTWSSAWSFVDKYYATPSDKYRDNWDAIFRKGAESDTGQDHDGGGSTADTASSEPSTDGAPSQDN